MIARAIQQKLFRAFFPPQKPVDPSRLAEVPGLLEAPRFEVERAGGCIRGLVLPSLQGQATGACILLHPLSRFGKYAALRGQESTFYRERGLDVVVFDFSGFGESDFIDLGFWRDVEVVANHIWRERQPKRLIVHGFSFGAFQGIPALPGLPEGAGVILENTYDSAYGYYKQWLSTRILSLLMMATRFRPFLEMDPARVFKDFYRTDLRIGLIACERDIVVPPDRMRALSSRIRVPHEMVTIAGAGHLEGMRVDPEAYRNFLEATLLA